MAGVRVLELARGPAAAFCGRQFAAWGAEVVMAEPEGGGELRSADTQPGPAGLWSPLFEYVAAGKLATTEPEARTLLPAANVLVTDLSDADLVQTLGMDASAMVDRFPRLVTVVCSAFGEADGDRIDALGLEALSGYLSLNGRPGEPPIPAPGRLIDFAIGANAFAGALAALFKAERTGWGDRVDVSGLETVASLLPFLRVQHLRADAAREGGTAEGVRLLPCRDGWVALPVTIAAYAPIYAEVLGVPPDAVPVDLHEGPHHTVVVRATAYWSCHTRSQSMREIFDALQARGVVCGMVRDLSAVLADEQLASRGLFDVVDHPTLGRITLAGAPASLSRAARPRSRCAPSILDRVRAVDLGWEPRPPPQGPRDPAPPLDGVRVLDLTQAWIGPYAGMLLADLGAEVIKVEGPARPDLWRTIGQATAMAQLPTDALNRSHYFNSANRSKRGLTLDLASVRGRELLLRLAATADVVLENFTPGVMARFGLDDAALAGARPDIVITAFSGFGRTGPWAAYKANGSSIEALAGWTTLHRSVDGAPVQMGFYQADPICGLQMAACTLAALVRRARMGDGGRVDGSMLDAAAGLIGDQLLAVAAGGEVEASTGRVRQAVGTDAWTVDGEAGPFAMRTLGQALDAPLLSGWFLPIETHVLGVHRYNGRNWRFTHARPPEPSPPPRLGEHSAEVLRALGLVPAEIAKLFADGVSAVRL